MPRSAAFQNENNFSRGLITEATGLNFPENASIDNDNCRFDEDGTVRRRRALDIETPKTLTVPASTLGVVREFIWEAVGNSGTRSFLVVQFGAGISFFQEDEDGEYSSGEKSFGILLATYQVGSPLAIEEHPCSFASGNGRLFIAQRHIDPLVVEYDEEADDITVTAVTIEIRDLEGVEDNLGVEERPTTLSNLHDYNLQNQGWNRDVLVENFKTWLVDKIDEWAGLAGTAGRSDFPSNADIWWLYKNENDQYSPTFLPDRIHLGNSPAPKGHWIYPAFDLDREDKVSLSGIPGELTDIRPSHVAFYAGRVWYSGVEADKFTQKVYYSQIIEGATQFGKCYQRNDPTSEQISDLLDSDGGRVSILDMGTVVNMSVVQDSLVIFSSEGIWTISGGDGTGFKSTDFSVRKLSSVECDSPYSFLDVDGLPVWWNVEGIYGIQPNEAGNQLQVNSLTDKTIKSFYQDILHDSRFYAKGAYDPLSKEIQWLYRSSAASEFADNFKYDRLLVLNTVSGAFMPWSTDTSLFCLAGIFVSEGTSFADPETQVVSGVGLEVVDASFDNIVVNFPGVSSNVEDGRFKYLSCAAGGAGSSLKFGPEVAAGSYTISAGLGHAMYDFENRLFYKIVNNGAPTADVVNVYTMTDNSLVTTIPLTWDADVTGVMNGPNYYNPNDGYFYIYATVAGGVYGSGTTVVVVDPVTGNNISTNASTAIFQDPYQWVIFAVDGVTHMASLQFAGGSQWKYSFHKFDGTSWTDLGDTAAFADGVTEGIILGVKEETGQSKLIWLDTLLGTVNETTVTSVGTLSTALVWTPPAIFSGFYLPEEGNILVRDDVATGMIKYSYDDGLFTSIWDRSDSFTTSLNIFPIWLGTRAETTIGMNVGTSLIVEVFNVDDGSPACSIGKVATGIVNSGHLWDDIGGTDWYGENSATFFRYQTSCAVSETGYTFGEEVVPTGTTRDYTDWINVNETGVDYTSYFLTGAKVHADGMRDFQSNYVSIFSEKETDSSCRMHGRFDWANSEISAEYSTPQQVYTERTGRAVQRRRLKVRGNGPALQMYFTSEAGKPFNIIGWSIFETAESLP